MPEGTLFRALLDDVAAWHAAGVSFEDCWRKLEDKWSACALCPELPGKSNIDAKFNSGYVLMGLLYGDGDFEKSVRLALICGQDSDCDPSTVGAVLGNFLGESRIPAKFKEALDKTGRKFSFTDRTYNDAVALNFKLMKEQFALVGARCENGSWRIPIDGGLPPLPAEQWPDGVYIYVDLKLAGNTVRFIEITPYSKNEEIAGFVIDLGDGTVFENVVPAFCSYRAPGSYTVTVTVKGARGSSFTVKKVFDVPACPNAPEKEFVICPVTTPCGGGSKEISIVKNGFIPAPETATDAMQYDTYILGDPHGNPPRTQYFGYVFREARTVSGLRFTDGNHFANGGWFEGGAPQVQVLRGGAWETVPATVSPPYPRGEKRSDFPDPYATYSFDFDRPVGCLGVRLFGLAGGSARFISVCELDVLP